MRVDGARVEISHEPIFWLIGQAYHTNEAEIIGPAWLKTSDQRFDIVATLPRGAARDQIPEMLKSLLTERFRLKTHFEKKEQAVYALEVARSGLRIRESSSGPGSAEHDGKLPPEQRRTALNGKGPGVQLPSSADGQFVHFGPMKVSLPELAEFLSHFTDRQIVDATDLRGRYEVTFQLSQQDVIASALPQSATARQSSNPAEAAPDPRGVSVFDAVKSLGLRLSPRKMPVTQLVVDAVERSPTAN